MIVIPRPFRAGSISPAIGRSPTPFGRPSSAPFTRRVIATATMIVMAPSKPRDGRTCADAQLAPPRWVLITIAALRPCRQGPTNLAPTIAPRNATCTLATYGQVGRP